MDERLKFVARLLDGEKMAVLYREFEISRKTGYKIYARYKDCGVEGLTDRSRRPYRHARQGARGPEFKSRRPDQSSSGVFRLHR
jgi:putative transposase